MVTFAFLGTQEVIVILVIALLVFGPQKLPEIGKQVGTAMRELRKMSDDVKRSLDFDGHGGYDHYNSSSYTYPTPQPLDQYGLDSQDEPRALDSAHVEPYQSEPYDPDAPVSYHDGAEVDSDVHDALLHHNGAVADAGAPLPEVLSSPQIAHDLAPVEPVQSPAWDTAPAAPAAVAVTPSTSAPVDVAAATPRVTTTADSGEYEPAASAAGTTTAGAS